MRVIIGVLGAMFLMLAVIACKGDDNPKVGESSARAEEMAIQEEKMPEIRITSKAFIHEGMIPARYTCDGEDISPEIIWKNVPEGAQTLALICDDPDAPSKTWVHWVAYNIPVSDTCLPAGMKADAENCCQGMTDFGRIGYGGPCPPGGVHRYFFRMYALDCKLDLKPGATKKELLQAMEGHILAQGELMGTYQRQS